MADPQVTVRIGADLKELRAATQSTVDELRKLADEVRRSKQPAQETADALGKMASQDAANRLRQLTDAFRGFASANTQAFDAYDRVQRALSQTFRAQGLESALGVVQQFSEEFGGSMFGMAEIQAATQAMQRFGVFSAQSFEQLANAAAGAGVPVAQLAEAYGRLSKYGDSDRSAKNLAKMLGVDPETVKNSEKLQAVLAGYAGAMEQSVGPGERLEGALYGLRVELGEAADGFKDTVADGLVPWINWMRQAPDAVKGVVGVGAELGGSLASMGATVFQVGADMKLMGVNAGTLKAGFESARNAAHALMPALLGLPGALAIAGAAFAVLWLESEKWKQAAVAQGQEIERSANAFRKLSADVRAYRKELQGAKGDIDALGAARRAGLTGDDVKADVSAADQERAKKFDQLQRVRAAQEGLSEHGALSVPHTNLSDVFPDQMAVSRQQLQDKELQLSRELKHLGEQAAPLRQVQQELSAIDVAAEKAAQNAERMTSYLSLAGQADDARSLRDALAEVNRTIEANAGQLATAKLPTSQAGLLETVKTGKDQTGGELTDEQLGAVRAQLGLYQQQESLRKKVQSADKQALDEKLRQRQLAHERDIEFHSKSLSSERTFYDEQLRLAEEAGEAGLEKQIEFKRKLNELDRADRTKRIQQTRDALEAEMATINQGLTEVREETGATASQTAAELERALARLDGFRQANAARINADSGLQSAFDSARSGLRGQLRSERSRIPGERLANIQTAIGEATSTATTDQQQLAIVQQGIQAVEAARKRGLVDAQDAQKVLNGLVQQEVDLKEKVRQTQLRHNQEMRGLKEQELSARGQDALSYITEGQSGTVTSADGSTISNRDQAVAQLKRSMEERLQLRMQTINEEMNEEIRAGATVEQAREKAQAKIKALYREEVEERRRTLKEIEDAENQKEGPQSSFTFGTTYASVEDAFAEGLGSGSFGKSNLGRGSAFKRAKLNLGDAALIGSDQSEALQVDPSVEKAAAGPGPIQIQVDLMSNGQVVDSQEQSVDTEREVNERMTEFNFEHRPGRR